MAGIIAPLYHVQSTARASRDGFPYFAHNDSVSALWSHKWRAPCAAGIYPFTDGRVEDFDPVFAELSRISADDPAILHRPDDCAKPFFPVADRLADAVDKAIGGKPWSGTTTRKGDARGQLAKSAPCR